MVFSSITFLFFFLPISLTIYQIIMSPVWLRKSSSIVWRRLGNLFLLFVSLVFYFWGENFLLWIVLVSTTIDYISGIIISRAYRPGEIQILKPDTPRSLSQRLGLILSICSNLAFLGYFKYFNFFMDTLNDVVPGATQIEAFTRVALPLGISFYTFQSMSYTIDVYRGDVRATRNFIDFACFVTMFPQLVAGPIVRYRDVAQQLTNRILTADKIVIGVRRFVIGLSKKVLIANTVAVASDAIFALNNSDLTFGLAFLGVVCYTLQIYYDFSGYSDMAIGLGLILGFRYPENFNYPYIARSIQDFWRRWHISLSTWFRDYLYIPLGGSRLGRGRTYGNLVTVFFLCGLWHGASWTFVVWGLYHGGFLILERIVPSRVMSKSPSWLAHVYTLTVVMGGWVLFRSETFSQATSFFSALVGVYEGTGAVYNVGRYLSADVALAIVWGVVFSAPVLPGLRKRIETLVQKTDGWIRQAATISIATTGAVTLMVLFFLCSIGLAGGTHNPFIYFRF